MLNLLLQLFLWLGGLSWRERAHVLLLLVPGGDGDARGGSGQGERIFEISWEPNFSVNNFAQNNGKIAPSSTR